MIERVRLPADIELEDRLAFGLTFRQLTVLVLAALLAYGVFISAPRSRPYRWRRPRRRRSRSPARCSRSAAATASPPTGSH